MNYEDTTNKYTGIVYSPCDIVDIYGTKFVSFKLKIFINPKLLPKGFPTETIYTVLATTERIRNIFVDFINKENVGKELQVSGFVSETQEYGPIILCNLLTFKDHRSFVSKDDIEDDDVDLSFVKNLYK